MPFVGPTGILGHSFPLVDGDENWLLMASTCCVRPEKIPIFGKMAKR